MGQLVGAATMLVGLVMLALPLSIIGTNFIEEDQQMKEHINEQKNAWKVEDPKTKVPPFYAVLRLVVDLGTLLRAPCRHLACPSNIHCFSYRWHP